MWEIRELPGGARQSVTESELTLEQPAEDLFMQSMGCVGADGDSCRRIGRTYQCL